MSKTKRKLKPLDYRDLCYRCASEYEGAGISIRESKNKTSRRCEKCRRQGNEYIVY